MLSEQEVNRAIDRYADTVRRICILHLKNMSDSEDVFQEVFLKYALRSAAFQNPEHEKAWIIRVTINRCKDVIKSVFRRRTAPLGAAAALPREQREQSGETLEAVLSLPKKYKDSIYLYYYEGYSAAEIAKILGKTSSTVYTLLARGRKLLSRSLGEEQDEG